MARKYNYAILRSVFFLFFLFLSGAAFPFEQRIISLSPAATEILFALGLGGQIIANTSFCDYPDEAKAIPKIGTFSELNVEKIIALKPDIIFTTGLEQARCVSDLRKLNFNVFVSDPRDIPELFQSIADIGRVTHRQQEAAVLLSGMQKRIDIIRSSVGLIPQDKRPRVFIEIWHDPIMTAGPGSIIDELITLAGGINIAYDAPRPYSRFSLEIVIQRNPEVIILGYMTEENSVDFLSKRLGWGDIKAVKNKRVILDINPDLIMRPGPRVVDGIEEIHKHLYGE